MKTIEKYKEANRLFIQYKYNEALKLYLELIQEKDCDEFDLTVYHFAKKNDIPT